MSERISPEGTWESPTVEVGDMQFHYGNTRIRIFSDQFQHLNHVEYMQDNGVLAGVRVTQEFMDTLMENEFPYQFDFFPDEGTLSWYVTAEAKALDEELEHFHG